MDWGAPKRTRSSRREPICAPLVLTLATPSTLDERGERTGDFRDGHDTTVEVYVEIK
jgi:hypothetical protein